MLRTMFMVSLCSTETLAAGCWYHVLFGRLQSRLLMLGFMRAPLQVLLKQSMEAQFQAQATELQEKIAGLESKLTGQ